ncbi:MAG: VWA domain-containing protein [Cellvibrionaceae bacterium]
MFSKFDRSKFSIFYKSKQLKKINCFHCLCLLLLPALASASDKTDVRLLIDVSGSMKKNDANNLRRPAVDLLVKLLPEDSEAGVWTFGQYVNMLVPHGSVNKKWRTLASEKTAQINSNGLYTNIGGVLEKATYDIQQRSNQPNSAENEYQHLILLTDGMVDISKQPEENQAEWRRISEELLPALKASNYKVHTIALSDNADTELLNKLSLATDGVAATANNADELMKIFLNALDSASPPEQVPLKGNSFVVDSSVEEFTALVFPVEGSPPAKLKSPENKEYAFDDNNEDVNWIRTDQYELLTVKRPVEGEWELLADLDPDSRVTIVSDLNLVVKPLKNNALKNSRIHLKLLLEEEGKKIVRPDLLNILDVSYSVQRHNDGEAWFDVIPVDLSLASTDPNAGIFSRQLDIFDTKGIYEIKVVVDGKSFKREFSHSIEIREPFIVETETQKKKSISHIVTTVTASNDDIDVAKTKIMARIEKPSKNNSVKTLTLTDFDSWKLDFIPEEQGIYKINLNVLAVKNNGDKFEFSSEEISIRYPEDGEFFLEDEKTNEEEEKPIQQTVAEEPNAEANVEEPKSKLWLYIGLGVGNLLILVIAFFAYRMIMGGKVEDELEDIEASLASDTSENAEGSLSSSSAVDNKENENANDNEKKEEGEESPDAASSDGPSMTDVDSSEGQKVMDSDDKTETEDLDNNSENPEKNSSDDAIGLDGSSGSSPDSSQAHSHDSSQKSSQDNSGEDEVEGITDVEFSLDDFEEDDDDDIDSEIDRELAEEFAEEVTKESEKDSDSEAQNTVDESNELQTETISSSDQQEDSGNQKENIKDEFDLSDVEDSNVEDSNVEDSNVESSDVKENGKENEP